MTVPRTRDLSKVMPECISTSVSLDAVQDFTTSPSRLFWVEGIASTLGLIQEPSSIGNRGRLRQVFFAREALYGAPSKTSITFS